MLTHIDKCLFCMKEVLPTLGNNSELMYQCFCTGDRGWYSIDRDFYDDLRDDSTMRRLYDFHIISGYIRDMFENGQSIQITNENLVQISKSPLIPSYVGDKVNKLLLYCYRMTKALGEMVFLNLEKDYLITYSTSPVEFNNILEYMQDKGFFDRTRYTGERVGDWGFIMTVECLEQGYQLEIEIPKSNQCFIAMSFNPELLSSFKEIVIPKVKQTGFEPITVDVVLHNDDIADRIIYEIKQSRFVIADFTEQKAGVYFEAGFARGIGLEVIWTVREDQITQCHFDTNHFNHITWRTFEELAIKLQDRILATIPGAIYSRI